MTDPHGAEKVTCGLCDGSGRVLCDECGGEGRHQWFEGEPNLDLARQMAREEVVPDPHGAEEAYKPCKHGITLPLGCMRCEDERLGAEERLREELRRELRINRRTTVVVLTDDLSAVLRESTKWKFAWQAAKQEVERLKKERDERGADSNLSDAWNKGFDEAIRRAEEQNRGWSASRDSRTVTDHPGDAERRARVLAGLDTPDPSIKWNAGKIIHITQADLRTVLTTLQETRERADGWDGGVYQGTRQDWADRALAAEARAEAAERDARALQRLEKYAKQCQREGRESLEHQAMAIWATGVLERIAEARQEEAQ